MNISNKFRSIISGIFAFLAVVILVAEVWLSYIKVEHNSLVPFVILMAIVTVIMTNKEKKVVTFEELSPKEKKNVRILIVLAAVLSIMGIITAFMVA